MHENYGQVFDSVSGPPFCRSRQVLECGKHWDWALSITGLATFHFADRHNELSIVDTDGIGKRGEIGSSHSGP